MSDVEFQTVKAEEVKFGRNNFLEVSRKKAVSDTGENEFVAISRGFFLPDGTKRFRRSLALPQDKSIIDFVISKLQEYGADMPDKPAEQPPAEAPAEEAPAEKPAAEEPEAEKPAEASTPKEAE